MTEQTIVDKILQLSKKHKVFTYDDPENKNRDMFEIDVMKISIYPNYYYGCADVYVRGTPIYSTEKWEMILETLIHTCQQQSIEYLKDVE